MDFVDELFEKYYGKEYLAARECKDIHFEYKLNIKKIAIQYFKLSIGGVERVISLLAPMFLDMGYEVIIITEERQEQFEYEFPKEVEIVTIPNKKECLRERNYKKRRETIQKIVRDKRIDLVCYQEASTEFLLYDFLSYKNSGADFILVKHEYLSQYMVGLNDILYSQKEVFPLLDKVLVLSNVERVFWQTLGVNVGQIFNPIGDYAIDSGKKENVDSKYIVWVGHLASRQKQYMDVVPIMKEVVKAIPDALLKIYGNECEQSAVNNLVHAIQESGLEDNILYCGYTTQDMGKIYGNAVVHLVTSAYETFPMSIYESRVSGVPLVLYKMPYLEMLRDKGGYIAVDYDDKEAAAKAIVDVLLNKDLSKKLSKEAFESAAAFSNEDLKKRWKEIFDSISNSQIVNERSNVEKSSDIAILLETMMYHYHKGVDYSAQRQCIFVQKVKLNEMKARLQIAVQHKNLPIVLYPYGKIGKEINNVLNQEHKLQVAFVVDNNYDGTEVSVKKIEELKLLDCSKYLFLICSNNMNCYDELRNNIRECVPRDNIIDLYP